MAQHRSDGHWPGPYEAAEEKTDADIDSLMVSADFVFLTLKSLPSAHLSAHSHFDSLLQSGAILRPSLYVQNGEAERPVLL